MNVNFRNFAIWLVILFMLMGLFQVFQSSTRGGSTTDKTYSQFMSDVDAGSVSQVTISDNIVQGTMKDGTKFESVIPSNTDIVPRLERSGVQISAKTPDSNPFWAAMLTSWLPFLVIIGVWFFFIRQMQGGGRGGAMGFGKSRAKLLTETHGKVTFEDVAGVDEAKQDLEEIVEFLKDPGKFQRLGGRIPRGVLLVGPPGTGKTLIARAVAGEANVPFFTISGSDFVEMFVGVGASRVRDMFEQAKKNAPCIIFIDEIDAVGRHRGAGLGGGNDEREQTLNQLLVEMDGFEANEGIILIAATNRPDVLDPALLRPGRFDRQVVVPNPDVQGREKILKVHVRKVPLAPDVDLKVLARGTPGFSGADLMNLVNEGALLAARRSKRFVTMAEFEDAKDKLMMGAERRTLSLTEEDKKLTAYHEAGHALLAIKMDASDPIHKATIIPRGRALGMVMRLPERDQVSLTRRKAYADLAVAMGGRVAEEEIFGYEKVTSGASADIKMATGLARAMATEWGMSDKLGPLLYGDNQDEVFLGRSMMQRSVHMSDETQQIVDAEVKRFVDEGYQTAQKVIRENIDGLHTIAKALLEYETLTGDEIRNLMDGIPPVREDGAETAPKSSGVPSAGKAPRKRPDAEPGGAPEPLPGA
jgi:cell division protease FtsH